jgi:hypothetical protein
MAWSPDGTHVAYAALESDRLMGEQDLTSIFSIALDGSDQRRLCAECSRTFYSQVPGPGVTIDNAGAQDFMVPDSLAWSPDGTRIAAPATSNGLLIVDVAEGSTSVIDTEEPVTAVAWSPDGNTLAASHTWFLAPYNALGEMAPTSGTWWYESEERAGEVWRHLCDRRQQRFRRRCRLDTGTRTPAWLDRPTARVHEDRGPWEACGARGVLGRGSPELDVGPRRARLC